MKTVMAQDVAKLKAQIRVAIREALAEFENKTGLSPSGITVQMMNISTLNDELPVYDLNRVDVEFKL